MLTTVDHSLVKTPLALNTLRIEQATNKRPWAALLGLSSFVTA